MTGDQQGVVLFLGLLLTVIFLLSSRLLPPPAAVPGRDQLLSFAAPPAGDELWVEVDGPVRNRGIYPLEKGKSVLEAMEKAGGSAGNLGLSPDAVAMKISKSGLLKVSGEGEDRARATLAPFDPAKMKVLSIPVPVGSNGGA